VLWGKPIRWLASTCLYKTDPARYRQLYLPSILDKVFTQRTINREDGFFPGRLIVFYIEAGVHAGVKVATTLLILAKG